MSANPYANPYAQIRCLQPNDSAYDTGDNAQDLIVEFPVMPEVLDLAREADYQVASLLPLPDGLHVYKSTNPLQIPVSFKLHAFSDYTSAGGVDLLRMSAALHAMTLPIRSNAVSPTESTTSADNARARYGVTDAAQGGRAAAKDDNAASTFTQDAANKNLSLGSDPNASAGNVVTAISNDSGTTKGFSGFSTAGTVPAFPPVCVLRLIAFGGATNTGWGIKCVGYVKSVSVKLRGPWLLGTSGDGQGTPDTFNLPTSAEFSFVFVHAPGYRNKMTDATTIASRTAGLSDSQAFAADVRDRLYNTEDLSFHNQGRSTYEIVGLGPSTGYQLGRKQVGPLR